MGPSRHTTRVLKEKSVCAKCEGRFKCVKRKAKNKFICKLCKWLQKEKLFKLMYNEELEEDLEQQQYSSCPSTTEIEQGEEEDDEDDDLVTKAKLFLTTCNNCESPELDNYEYSCGHRICTSCEKMASKRGIKSCPKCSSNDE